MVNDKTDKSLPALFSDLMRETLDLIRKEFPLRADVGERVQSAQRGIASIAVGAAVTLAGLVILLLAVVNGLARFLPPALAPWLAPLIVGGLVLLIGYLMIKSGQSTLKAENLVPQRSIDSLRTDKAILQEKVQ